MQQFKSDMLTSVATRRAYEIEEKRHNDTKRATLNSFEARLQNDAVIALLFASNINVNTLNRQERKDARFNVKSFFKIIFEDNSAATMNHYTKAILLATIALAKNDLTLTHEDACFVCSLDSKHRDNSRAKIMKSAQYQAHVAPNTVSTQHSSSINSLQALNVLVESRDAANHVCYTLADNDFTKELCANVQA